LQGCQPVGSPENETKILRWATSAVGSAGYRAKINLMSVLNREMTDYRIEVMPTSGAMASMRGYALGQFDGFYGADIAFHEMATNSGRFQDFGRHIQHEPIQSFWAYTLEVGVAVRANDRKQYQSWQDLNGKPLFTDPTGWDVSAQLERALRILGVQFNYRELDLTLAGGALADGTIDGFIVYTTGMVSPAAWVAEAELAVRMSLLNPSAEELNVLQEAGMEIVAVDTDVFRNNSDDENIILLPFFYGFHTGSEMSAEDMYRMLTIIEAHTDELAQVDPAFDQLASNMPEMQRRGVATTIDSARVHPGLARYMRERGVWNPDWDNRIAPLP